MPEQHPDAELQLDLSTSLTMAEAAKRIRGHGGKSAHVDTVRRWANPRRGCYPAGPDGPRVVLKSVRVGSELLTSAEWVAEFEAERVRLGQRTPATPARREPTARRRALEDKHADQVLREAGIL